MVGFFILPAAGYVSLTLFLYVSQVCFLKKTVSKMCLSKIAQYHHALLNIPQKKPKNICLRPSDLIRPFSGLTEH